MKEIKSWKRSWPPYILLSCPVNLLFQIFLLLKKLSRFIKKFYFWRKKLLQFFVLLFSKAETFTKMCKNREKFCPRKFLPLKYVRFEKWNLKRTPQSAQSSFLRKSNLKFCIIYIQHDFIHQHLGLSKGQASMLKNFVIN